MVSLQYTSYEGKRGNHVNITKNCECGTSHISQHWTFTFQYFSKYLSKALFTIRIEKDILNMFSSNRDTATLMSQW